MKMMQKSLDFFFSTSYKKEQFFRMSLKTLQIEKTLVARYFLIRSKTQTSSNELNFPPIKMEKTTRRS